METFFIIFRTTVCIGLFFICCCFGRESQRGRGNFEQARAVQNEKIKKYILKKKRGGVCLMYLPSQSVLR